MVPSVYLIPPWVSPHCLPFRWRNRSWGPSNEFCPWWFIHWFIHSAATECLPWARPHCWCWEIVSRTAALCLHRVSVPAGRAYILGFTQGVASPVVNLGLQLGAKCGHLPPITPELTPLTTALTLPWEKLCPSTQQDPLPKVQGFEEKAFLSEFGCS